MAVKEVIIFVFIAIPILIGFIYFFGLLGKGIIKDKSKTDTTGGVIRFIVIGIITLFIWYQLAKAGGCDRIPDGYGDNPTETY